MVFVHLLVVLTLNLKSNSFTARCLSLTFFVGLRNVHKDWVTSDVAINKISLKIERRSFGSYHLNSVGSAAEVVFGNSLDSSWSLIFNDVYCVGS